MPLEKNRSKLKSNSPNLNGNSNNFVMAQLQHQPPIPSPSSPYPLGISFSSNEVADRSDDISYKEKRTAHNALERQRREGLNTRFQELAHVLPELQKVLRPSKSMIVAKSLEFVSAASERELQYKGELNALKKENELLLRQASLCEKGTRKRSVHDKPESSTMASSSSSSSSSNVTISKKYSEKNLNNVRRGSKNMIGKTSSVVRVKNPASMSRMKPQLRKTSISTTVNYHSSTSNSPSSDYSENDAFPDVPIAKRSPSLLSSAEIVAKSKKRALDDVDNVDTEVSNCASATSYTAKPNYSKSSSSLPSAAILPPQPSHKQPQLKNVEDSFSFTPEPSTSKRRKRNATIDDYSSRIVSQSVYDSSSNSTSHPPIATTPSPSAMQHQQQQTFIHPHQHPHQQQQQRLRFNSLQPPSTNVNHHDIVSNHFDITSPTVFSTEQLFFNNQNLERHIVSAIPAVRTPVGNNRSNTISSSHHLYPSQQQQPQPQYQPYDSTLDIINSLMQDEQEIPPDTHFYWNP